MSELDKVERLITEAAASELPALLGELGRLHSLVLARLASTANGHGHSAPAQPDTLLDAKEAARRLGLSVDALYRRKDWPFAVRIGRRVRFSAQGVERFIRQRRGA